jgi:Holliday junction resolvase RusA-like endonuclease
MSRSVQCFLPTPPPSVTHYALEIRRGKGRQMFIGKSDRLRAEEDRLRPYVAKLAPDRPLSGKLRETVKLVWPTNGEHEQGEPKETKPDADNVIKTFNDLLETCHVIVNDAMICDMRIQKMYGDPAGIWVRVEEIED